LTISTATSKLEPIYRVKAQFKTAQNQTKELNIEAPFARWFSSDGYFVTRPFQQFFASGIPLVGSADPKNVVEEIERKDLISGNSTSRDAGQPIVRDFGVSSDELPGMLDALKAFGGPPRAGSPAGKSRKKA
jgi:hypothetical protein